MLRTLFMGIGIPTIMLTSAAAWAGVPVEFIPIEIVPITSVPEPASLLLLAGGVAGIAAVKRLRRRR